jgi:hypothetical protein
VKAAIAIRQTIGRVKHSMSTSRCAKLTKPTASTPSTLPMINGFTNERACQIQPDDAHATE